MHICKQVCIQLKRWLNTHMTKYWNTYSSIDKCEAWVDNLKSSFKKEVMLSARNGVDASIFHLLQFVTLSKWQ